MKLMLTSFGIGQSYGSDLEERSPFYGMPPVSFRRTNEAFMADYDLLLLCDKLIMDGTSFARLAERPFPAYTAVAETFKALKAEGRIEVADFDAVLRSNADLLGRMVDHDIHTLDQWVIPLRESITIWRDFAAKSKEWVCGQYDVSLPFGHHCEVPKMHGMPSYHAYVLSHEFAHLMHSESGAMIHFALMVDEALNSSAKRRRKDHREALRETLKAYLTYVNANLILSNELEVGFHDWLDFTPFYAAKFLSVGKGEDPIQQGRKQVEKLFSIPFPELAITDTRSLMKALNDRRIADLRQLINDAVAGKVEFDDKFAKAMLREVLSAERTATRWRSIVGYLTVPLELIPWVGVLAEKAVGETVNSAIGKKLKHNHRWFYMLSDIAELAGRTTK